MEMEINPEYKKLIGKLNEALKEGGVKRTLDLIGEVKYALEQLGSSPILPDNANKFKEIVKGMLGTYVRKNHDYGNSFDKSLDKFGLVASVVRIGDKMNRIESLIQKEAMVQDESIRDTLLDMANYAIMTVMWMDNQKKCDICQS